VEVHDEAATETVEAISLSLSLPRWVYVSDKFLFLSPLQFST